MGAATRRLGYHNLMAAEVPLSRRVLTGASWPLGMPGRRGTELRFAVESWARGGDRLSALVHDRLRRAKEVQLYMWTSVLERVPRLAGGRLLDGVHVQTRRVPPEAFAHAREVQ